MQDWIERVARIPVDDTNEVPDACIIELGGTVGDIESGPFIESMRQLKRRVGKENFLQIHVSLVPVINGEQKTKPTQQAIRDVRSAGLSPDLVRTISKVESQSKLTDSQIACRCAAPLEKATTDKVAQFCQVEPSQVVGVHDVNSTYHVPLLLEKQGLVPLLRDILRLDALSLSPTLVQKGDQTWNAWKTLTCSQDHLFQAVSIVLVGKYTNLHDSYLSVIKSLEHAAMACSRKLKLVWVDASHLEEDTQLDSPADFHKAWHELCTAQGVLVPGGFGSRGTEGMIKAANWARTKKIPFLGVCLGMQIAVIEFARNVCKIPKAASIELDANTTDPVIIFMPEIDRTTLGGTMRLGLRPTHFQPNSEWSKLRALYTETPLPMIIGVSKLPNGTSPKPTSLIIFERHRHRYEVNPTYIDTLSSHGLSFVGKDDRGERMEILEMADHPWFVGVQFHPEYLSRVLKPSKPYLGFVAASAGCLGEVLKRGTRLSGDGNAPGEGQPLVNDLEGMKI